MNLRRGCVWLFVLASCTHALDDDPVVAARRADTLRVVAANVSTEGQEYREPGIRILRGVQPDVALIQEMNYASDTDADLRGFVDAAFGSEFAYCREPQPERGAIPNGIVSRYPIVECGEWQDAAAYRDVAWARIDIPGPTDLYAISVHLLTTGVAQRNAQAALLLEHLRELPADALVTLGGDFNTKYRDEPAIETLAQALDTAGPYPVDRHGNDNTNATRRRPLDWVLGNAALSARAVPVEIGDDVFPAGFVADTRVAPVDALAPALPEDSAAPEMQHMAIVRDFALE
jgi:endonuclease/exonuclease/phosphatase family metal-dependent hydrolase